MSVRLRSLRLPPWWSRAVDRLITVVFTVTAGVVLGMQFIEPNKRVIPVIVAIVMFGLAWRVDMVTGLGILAVALPFPRVQSFGNSNLAFILLMLVVWLLRLSLGQSPAPRPAPVNAPLLTLFVVYVLSFYNVADAELLTGGLTRFQMMVAAWLMFYLVANSLQNRRQFERMLGFQAFSVLLVCLLGVFEAAHHGGVFIREWIDFQSKTSSPNVDVMNLRVGSVFLDYELLCEYCALNILLVLFLLLRARTAAMRAAFAALLTLIVFTLFTTVTRGGIISLAVGLVYLVWLVRRRVHVVGLTIAGAVTAALAIGMNWYVATFTRTGNLFGRLSGSKVQGLVPDTRAQVWPIAWGRIFEHPLIGHGPEFITLSGGRIYTWPHCLYLYLGITVGFVGVGVFLWLMWTMFRITRPDTDDLLGEDPVRSYLIIARVQVLVFVVDQIKIEYLRNDNYQFQVWMMFALMVAAHNLSRAPMEAEAPARRVRRVLGPTAARSITR